MVIEYNIGKQDIKSSFHCKGCPLRLYSKDDKIIYGTGNIYAGTVIILHPYNIQKSEIVTKLINVYSDLFGINLLEQVYITRYVKCFNHNEYNSKWDAVRHCFPLLCIELSAFKPRLIICENSNFCEVLKQYFPNTIIRYLNNTLLDTYKDKESKQNKLIKTLTLL